MTPIGQLSHRDRANRISPPSRDVVTGSPAVTKISEIDLQCDRPIERVGSVVVVILHTLRGKIFPTECPPNLSLFWSDEPALQSIDDVIN